MEIIKTPLPGLLIIKPQVFEDERGYFFESFNEKKFSDNNIKLNFVQDNQSKSAKGVIRGLHYQLAPYAQTKLVRVLQGVIYDVAVDIRRKSPTFGQWYGVDLSSDNKLQLLVPKGFAHGFSVLSATAEILYKCDSLYNKESERGLYYADPKLNIDWKINAKKALVSAKDQMLPAFDKADMNFVF